VRRSAVLQPLAAWRVARPQTAEDYFAFEFDRNTSNDCRGEESSPFTAYAIDIQAILGFGMLPYVFHPTIGTVQRNFPHDTCKQPQPSSSPTVQLGPSPNTRVSWNRPTALSSTMRFSINGGNRQIGFPVQAVTANGGLCPIDAGNVGIGKVGARQVGSS
jgi:hypothetical protein